MIVTNTLQNERIIILKYDDIVHDVLDLIENYYALSNDEEWITIFSKCYLHKKHQKIINAINLENVSFNYIGIDDNIEMVIYQTKNPNISFKSTIHNNIQKSLSNINYLTLGRKWIYLNDLYDKYNEFSNIRNKIFNEKQFNSFYVSTCVEGHNDKSILVEELHFNNMDSIEIMNYEEIMPHTSKYNVSFERGAIINNKYILISGTASISNEGEILYKDNIEKQVHHSLYNIKTLLENYELSMENLLHCNVYVKNYNDIEIVELLIKSQYPELICTYLHSKICREDWLMEIDAFGVK